MDDQTVILDFASRHLDGHRRRDRCCYNALVSVASALPSLPRSLRPENTFTRQRPRSLLRGRLLGRRLYNGKSGWKFGSFLHYGGAEVRLESSMESIGGISNITLAGRDLVFARYATAVSFYAAVDAKFRDFTAPDDSQLGVRRYRGSAIRFHRFFRRVIQSRQIHQRYEGTRNSANRLVPYHV